MTLDADRLEADAPAPAPESQRARMGRAPVTTHGELSHLALGLFLERGFDKTTVDDIVRAAGIGRRTFFRYFASKNDLPWGDFDRLLDEMRAHLAAMPDDIPLMDALREAVVDFNRFPDEELTFHRERMWLLLNVPSLVAHSTLRYASWRQVIAEYVARRLGVGIDSLTPQAIAWSCLGLCLAAYEQWLAHDDADLLELLDASFRRLAAAYSSAA
ncbi:mycofactocin system transcriptional regulator [Microbacterium sp.]|uniref:mycofactocin system transcriptional regulator n=1 Tax=Microbacterium sp. TaxID=51671 RepID=UPI002D7969A0|nr:mycofactocin system transcriptional regulator [Microbacterium sp.]HET6302350.1 mycofactocin system transcriptional regulator [Microbacterium sp.]